MTHFAGRRRYAARACAMIGTLTVALPFAPPAQAADDEWHINASVYGWLPDLSGNVSFPTGGDASFDIGVDKIVDNLKFTFMGMLSAQKGRWGIGTDVIYMDLGGTEKSTRDLTIGGEALPANVRAKLGLGVSGWIWTTVGFYRLVENPGNTFDLLAGARMASVSSDLDWSLDGDIGSLPLPGRDGQQDISDTLWDGIVGFKGRAAFGTDDRWFLPYYFDVGTGASDVTWQAMVGIGYQFDWGGLSVAWRYMDYEMSPDDVFQSMTMNGPALGATFTFR